ncbi:MAG: hypothetical protein NTX50_08490 [Candidatus Sumerlaeota bacterium]|nr:hypothetical protein [Candidatus Sumerlaeota bacterium]
MPIDFAPSRWDKVKETYRQWWAGQLGRPIIPIELRGRDPGRPQPPAPLLTQACAAKLDWPVEDLVDRLDWELSGIQYVGDAYPYFNLDCFGPGVMAAFLGARIHDATGRIWFFPQKDLPISEIHFEYDPDNIWLHRVKELCAAMMRRWQGQVLVGMADLGGNLDVLHAFRPGERLVMDLIEYPEEVKRLTWEAHDLWHRYYQEINAVLQPVNPGYTDWSSIYSDRPSYILQCDFSYMISPAMFEEFVKPELEATSKRLERSFYHLDGRGQLPHLDHVLSLDHIQGVQWVPGAGAPDCGHWPEVYRKIHVAGRLTQIWDGFDALAAIKEQTGAVNWIHHRVTGAPIEQESEIRRRLEKYGIE